MRCPCASQTVEELRHGACTYAGMLGIHRRYSHFVYGALQSGLTSAVAAAIASVPFLFSGGFMRHWVLSWLVSWAVMLPVVLLAAPVIRSLSLRLTREN